MSNKEEKKEITLAELATEMRDGFNRVQQGFETMMGAIDVVEERINGKIDGIDGRITKVGGRLTKIEDTMVTKTHLDIRFEKIEPGLFTEDEKKSVLDTVKLVNKQLEVSVLGKESITLTRSEYDALINVAHLPNRFLNTVEVD